MSIQSQTPFVPATWLGTFIFPWSPSQFSLDAGTNVNIKNIMNGEDQNEPVGYKRPIATMSGSLKANASPRSSIITNGWQTFFQTGLIGENGRPLGCGHFSSDASYNSANPSSNNGSEVLYSGVGYLTAKHLEDSETTQDYVYPYQFTFQEAGPQTILNTSGHAASNYNFPLAAITGYIAGVGISGGASTAGAGLSYLIYDKSSNFRGSSGGTLGALLATDPYSLASSPDVILPIQDANGNQSIQIAATDAGTWQVRFQQTFSSTPLNVYLVILPL